MQERSDDDRHARNDCLSLRDGHLEYALGHVSGRLHAAFDDLKSYLGLIMANHTGATLQPHLARLLLNSSAHSISREVVRRTLGHSLPLSRHDRVVLKSGIPRWWHRVLAKVDELRNRGLLSAKNRRNPRLWSLASPQGVRWAQGYSPAIEEMVTSEIPLAVRILPLLREKEFPDSKDAREVQDNYFLNQLPFEQNGCYNYKKRGLVAKPGTVVLFQWMQRVSERHGPVSKTSVM